MSGQKSKGKKKATKKVIKKSVTAQPQKRPIKKSASGALKKAKPAEANIKPKPIPAIKPARKTEQAGPETQGSTSDKTAVKRIRKGLKKSAISVPPPPVVEVSPHSRVKVRSILVSQPQPSETEKNPYIELGRKHNVQVTFRQFIRVEGLTAQEFRAQRIDILEHGAVILTSKMAVDHYFRICNEMRITVPETMKYFCINEQTAYYLQKYIQYRKRKIFFGHGTIIDLVDVIRKNKAEKFLLPSSDVHKEQIADFLEEVKITFTKAVFYKTVSADLSDIKTLDGFDVIIFFTPAGIRSLKHNFPNFKQGSTRIAAFGHTTAQQAKILGYRLDIFAPNPQNPSMSGALDAYIKEANKR